MVKLHAIKISMSIKCAYASIGRTEIKLKLCQILN